MMPAPSAPAAEPATPRPAGRFNLTGLAALFGLTLRQQVRGKRLLVLAFLFCLPAGLAVLVRAVEPWARAEHLELVLVYHLIPHALVPLAALLYASGVIQDEVEEQTLTYLLVRPLPRWALYLTKLLATLVLTSVLAGVFTAVTYLAVHAGAPDVEAGVVVTRALKTVALQTLALAAYCGLFGLAGVLTRRSFVTGVAYIVLFEGVLANVPVAVRGLTVVYYFRVLCRRWLELPVKEWSIDLEKAASSGACVLALASAAAVAGGLGALVFAGREFRLKTPEGS